jgi:hypothetical protein
VYSNNKILILLLSIIFSTQIFGPSVYGHGVPNWEEQMAVIQISETFSRQSLSAGEALTITGELIANEEININGPLSVYLETEKLCFDLEIFFTQPEGLIGKVNKDDKIPYELKLKLDSGIYHVHTKVNIEGFGLALGPGQTILFEGNPGGSHNTSFMCNEQNKLFIIGGVIFAIVISGGICVFILKRKKTSIDIALNDQTDTNEKTVESHTEGGRRCKVCDTNIAEGEKICPGCGDVYS